MREPVEILRGFGSRRLWLGGRRVRAFRGRKLISSLIGSVLEELSLREYEEIRASPVHFPVKVGHDYPEFERVVAVSDGYAVVEKIGAAAEVAKTLDPRSRVNGGSLVEVKNGPS